MARLAGATRRAADAGSRRTPGVSHRWTTRPRGWGRGHREGNQQSCGSDWGGAAVSCRWRSGVRWGGLRLGAQVCHARRGLDGMARPRRRGGEASGSRVGAEPGGGREVGDGHTSNCGARKPTATPVDSVLAMAPGPSVGQGGGEDLHGEVEREARSRVEPRDWRRGRAVGEEASGGRADEGKRNADH